MCKYVKINTVSQRRNQRGSKKYLETNEKMEIQHTKTNGMQQKN